MSATRAEPVHTPWPGLIAAYRDRLPVDDTWAPVTLLEGEPAPKRLVVVEFDSIEQARAWYDSPEYAPALKLRQASSTGRLLLVEGVYLQPGQRIGWRKIADGDRWAMPATIEDPKVFTRPWKMSFPLYRRLEKNVQTLDYECLEFEEPFLPWDAPPAPGLPGAPRK